MLKRFPTLLNGIVALALITLAVLQGTVLSHVHVLPQVDKANVYWGAYANSRVIKRLLGLRIVASDLIWIDMLFKADTIHEKAGFTAFYKATRTIMELDPQNFLAAWFSGLYLSVIKDDIKGASMLFDDAVHSIETMPWIDSQLRGSIYFAYGYHALFEEHDLAKGAWLIEKSSKEAGAPLLAKAMAETLKTPTGRIEVGFRVLNDFYKRAKTPEERQRIEKKMSALLVERELLELNTQFDDYIKRSAVEALPRRRAFQNFLRFHNHKGRDILGRRLTLDDRGRIVSQE